MRLRIRKTNGVVLACIALLVFATQGTSNAPGPLPNPVLNFMGQEFYSTGGKDFTRYKYEVSNLDAYPNTLFAAAPELPPCGKNPNSARTWVDIFDQRGTRLYGFCALGNHDDLRGIYFSLENDVVPPSYVYIEMTDRKTNTKYKSNLADTTL